MTSLGLVIDIGGEVVGSESTIELGGKSLDLALLRQSGDTGQLFEGLYVLLDLSLALDQVVFVDVEAFVDVLVLIDLQNPA